MKASSRAGPLVGIFPTMIVGSSSRLRSSTLVTNQMLDLLPGRPIDCAS